MIIAESFAAAFVLILSPLSGTVDCRVVVARVWQRLGAERGMKGSFGLGQSHGCVAQWFGYAPSLSFLQLQSSFKCTLSHALSSHLAPTWQPQSP